MVLVKCVRHGESLFNAARDVEGIHACGQSQFIDCGLTEKGRRQALELRSVLTSLNEKGSNVLILVSPLHRTLQTVELAIGVDAAKDMTIQGHLRVVPFIREHLEESCDIGRPPEVLKQLHPWANFDSLESFWYLNLSQKTLLERIPCHHNKIYDTIKNDLETEEQLLERVAFTKLYILQHVHYHTTILFGHANFFHRFTGRKIFVHETNEFDFFGQWLENCEVFDIEIDAN